MKLIRFVYICFFTLGPMAGSVPVYAGESSLGQQFVNASNQVGAESFPLATPARSSGFSGGLDFVESRRFGFDNTAYSPVPQAMRKELGSGIISEDEDSDAKNLFELLEENVFMQNPTVPPEVYSQILGNKHYDSSSSVLDPCASPSQSVLEQDNLEALSVPIQDIQNRQQFCGFENQETIGTMHGSVGFCECVREKTKRNGTSEEGLYKKIADPDKLQRAMDLYRQSLVDKVMPELLEEISEMTESSNDFLSTDELSHMLYEVHSDVKSKQARSILEGMRQGMHTCSGLGMNSMINELFNSEDGPGQSCDEQSARFLLEGFVKATQCDSPECDSYKSFAQSQKYADERPQNILSDFLTHKFSVNLIDHDYIVDDDFVRLSNDEKFNKVVTTADAMTEFDSSGKPFVHPDYVGLQRRLPPEDQLALLHEFMQKKDEEGFRVEDYFQDKEEELDQLIKTLVRNNLYKENGIFSKPVSEMDAADKALRLSRFTDRLKEDKERRVESLDMAKSYLNDDVDPVESMKRMIINNYLYLGDDVLKGCAETRRKLQKLCASISGNGMALFSHPDFRNYTDEMLLDEELQKDIAEVVGDDVEERSPFADQLYCHANFSSLSSDCDEQATLEAGHPISAGYCSYDAMWFLAEENAGLNNGHTGNSRMATADLVEQAQNRSRPTSSSDFEYVTNRKNSQTYKDPKRELNINAGIYDSFKSMPKKDKDMVVKADAQRPLEAQKPSEEMAVPTTQNKGETESSQQSLNAGHSAQKRFSENFSSVKPSTSELDKNYHQASKDVPKNSEEISDQNNAMVEQIDAAQQSRTAELENQLEQSQQRQRELQNQLDQLLSDSDQEQKEDHENKLNEKRRELKELQSEVEGLETDIKQEKSVARQDFSPEKRPTPSLPSRPSAPRSSSPAAENAQASGTAPPSAEFLPRGRAPASSSGETQANTEHLGDRAATNLKTNNLSLTSGQASRVLPQTLDLVTVAKDLSGQRYVLMDIGQPGMAEKIVFQYGPDGEVLFDESGDPIILSREVVEVDDAEADEKGDERSPASEEMEELGEQDDSPSYRWSDVEDLLDL